MVLGLVIYVYKLLYRKWLDGNNDRENVCGGGGIDCGSGDGGDEGGGSDDDSGGDSGSDGDISFSFLVKIKWFFILFLGLIIFLKQLNIF